MFLLLFKAKKFRNLEDTDIKPDVNCNIFYGSNGSGKTSLLEAIYYLSLCRSFRSHLLRRIIKYGSQDFSLFGEIKKNSEDKITHQNFR
jgi:DNA replication and repair protein RecF